MAPRQQVIRSALGTLAAASLATSMSAIGTGTAAAQEAWSPAQRVSGAERTATGVLGNGTSVTLGLQAVTWTDRSEVRRTGTALVEYRRPVGGSWSAQRQVRRWAAVGCSLTGGAEGSTVAAAVRCSFPQGEGPLARALVWARPGGWRAHRVVNRPLRVDQSPSGNVVVSGSRGRVTHLLKFNQNRRRWNALRKRRPAGTRSTWAVVDNGGRLLLAHDVSQRDHVHERLVIQRRSGGTWRSPRVLDRPPQRLDIHAVDLNGPGGAVVTWITGEDDREGTTTQVLKTAVGTRRGWVVTRLDRGFDELLYAHAGITRTGVVILAWQRDQGSITEADPLVLSRTRSAAGRWGPKEQLGADRSLLSLDVNATGRAAVGYCSPFRCSSDASSNIVRLRSSGQTTWGPEQQLGEPDSSGIRTAVGGNGTTTAWWLVPEPQPSLGGLYSSTAE